MNTTNSRRPTPPSALPHLAGLALALVALAFASDLVRAEANVAEQIPAETKLSLPSGATFPIAAGWWVTRSEEQLVLETPERDMTLWYLEFESTPEIADGEAAVREGWKRVRPDFALAVDRATNPPPTGGWEAVTQVGYITPTEENRAVVGIARRVGTHWYVQLLDGGNGAFDRRGAQIGAALDGLEPPGLDKESFAGKIAQKLDDARLAQ